MFRVLVMVLLSEGPTSSELALMSFVEAFLSLSVNGDETERKEKGDNFIGRGYSVHVQY